jgi:hypothetical protein
MWQTVGLNPNAASACKPPMPSTNSCLSGLEIAAVQLVRGVAIRGG